MSPRSDYEFYDTVTSIVRRLVNEPVPVSNLKVICWPDEARAETDTVSCPIWVEEPPAWVHRTVMV